MKVVQISVSYFAEGRVVTSTYSAKVEDPCQLFDNAIADARAFAAIHKDTGGYVHFTQTLRDGVYKLHVEYHGLHIPVISRVFLFATERKNKVELIDEQLNPQYV